MIALEDDFTDVLRKTLTGLGLTAAEAAKRAGLAENDVHIFLQGAFSSTTARQLAPVLDLNAEAFAKHASYQPQPLSLPDIVRLNLPFGEQGVNAWLVQQAKVHCLFDAGYNAQDLVQAMNSLGQPMPERVFITHAHRDHIGAIGQFLATGLPVHAADIPRTLAMKPGDTVNCGTLVIRACDLSGHATPALGFHIDGLNREVLVTGDALFAGSIGGCASPAIYQHALRRLREVLGPLPDATVLLPGHGPATTLGEERASNPFL